MCQRTSCIIIGAVAKQKCNSDAVDIYNSVTKSWSSSKLTLKRFLLSAASIANVVICAGSQDQNAGLAVAAVDIYSMVTGTWSAAMLIVPGWSRAAASVGNVAVFARGTSFSVVYSSAVDLYNSVSGKWSTTQLSVARRYLAVASSGIVAIFAGGRIADGASNAVDVYKSVTGT